MKVRTLQPVEYDGKKVKVGSTLDVSEATGEQLIESGSAEPAGKAKRDAAAPPGPDGQPPAGGPSEEVAADDQGSEK